LRLKQEEEELLELWKPDSGPPTFVGSFHRPVDGEVTATFGTHRIFNGKLASIHYGLDLDGMIGDPIRTMQSGRIVMSSMRWASGGTVIIDHGGGLFTSYFHMSRRDRKPGDWVKPGDILGAVGNTGRVTGPHLHLQFFIRAKKLGQKAGAIRTFAIDP